MTRTGANLVVEALAAAGVRHLFSLSGNQILSLYDASLGSGLSILHTRHEAAAVHMADAWGRLTEEPGVALVTAGPGHCNAISALYGALMSESPVVLLSGHAPTAQLGRGAFQEMDQAAVAAPVCKASWMAKDAARLGEDIAIALELARSGRPGPVHVSLPGDLLEAKVAAGDGARAPRREAPVAATAAEVEQALALLAAARRPVIMMGGAMARGPRRAAVARLSRGHRRARAAHGEPARVQRPVAAPGRAAARAGRPARCSWARSRTSWCASRSRPRWPRAAA